MTKRENIAQVGHNKAKKTLTQYALDLQELLRTHDRVEGEQRYRAIKIGEILIEVREAYFPNCAFGVWGSPKGVTRPMRSAATAAFLSWCEKNIHQKNGRPYTKRTIAMYILFAKDPRRLDAAGMCSSRSHGKNYIQSKKYEKIIKKIPAAEAFVARTSIPVHDQVNFLVTAWEKATTQARNEFMNLVGLKFK